MKRIGAALLVAIHALQLGPSTAGAEGGSGGGSGGSGPSLPAMPANVIVASTAPIKLPGGGAVTDTGAATYSMSLDTPDGPGGMTPGLGLAYAGNTNGSVGVGFGITGISSITPCHKTYASEGNADGIDFDATDAYCLDGQKLVKRGDLALSGGEDDVVMSTEVDSSVRVVMHRDLDNGGLPTDPEPNSFTVFHPDGRIATYTPVKGSRRRGTGPETEPIFQGHGETMVANSRDALVAVAFLIEAVTDRSGNKIKFHYDIGADATGNDHELSYRIRDIEYSYNAPSTTPRRRIVFVYEPRTDAIVQYVSGVKIVTRSRLKTIQMFAPNPASVQQIWSYQFSYEYGSDTRRSRLTGVRKLDQFSVASWQRQFEWTNTATVPVFDHVAGGPAEFDKTSFSRDGFTLARLWEANNHGTAYVYDEPWVPRSDVRLMVFDADGDGIDDVLYRTRPTFVQYDAWVRDITYDSQEWDLDPEGLPYTRVSGKIFLRSTGSGSPLGVREEVSDYLEPPAGDGLWQAHLGKSRVADLDGDGRPNLLVARTLLSPNSQWQDGAPDVTNFGQWLFAYADVGHYLGSGKWELSQAGAPFEFIGRVVMKGAVWRESNEISVNINGDGFLEWKYFIPPFQHVLADLDGDGRVEGVDAFWEPDANGEPIDTVSPQYVDIDWFRLGSPGSGAPAFPYTTRLSADPPSTPARQFERTGLPFTGVESWACGNGRAVVLDYEGDGRSEVLVSSDLEVGELEAMGVYSRLGAVDMPYPNPAQPVLARESTELWGGDCGLNRPDLIMGDFNGDGLDDVLYPPGSYVNPTLVANDPDGIVDDFLYVPNTVPRIRWNLGNGFGPLEDYLVDDPLLGLRMYSEQPISPKPAGAAPVGWDLGTRAVDLNRDGLTDIIAMRFEDQNFLGTGVEAGDDLSFIDQPKIIIAYISTGSGFIAKNLGQWDANISAAEGFTTFQVGDVTGDGATDVVQVVDGSIVTTELPWRVQPDLLRFVKDTSSNHALEEFVYSSSWWGSGLRPEPVSCLYPNTCTRRSFNVVRQHNVYAGSDGSGNARYRKYLHAYTNPRTNLRGRGFLGFAEHRIWDLTLGAETLRTFDNVTPYDPQPSYAGGEFYPYAMTPVAVRTTTPTEALPTEAEITGSFPGHSGASVAVPTRTVVTTTDYELRHHEILPQLDGTATTSMLRLPSSWTTTESDVLANAVDVDTSFPRYDSYWSPTDERTISGSTQYDDFGQPTLMTREVAGGVRNVVEIGYENRVDPTATLSDWILGLSNFVHWQSYVPGQDDPSVGRVLRTTYDAAARPTQMRFSGRDQNFYACASAPAACEIWELDAVTTDISLYDTSGNPRTITTTAAGSSQTRTVTASFDSDRVYPTQVVDPLGFATVALTHPGLGVPVLAVDVNGVPTTMTYDGFGRPTKIVTPNRPNVSRVYAPLSGNKGMLIDTYEEVGPAAEWAHASMVSDDLGRPIQESVRGFTGALVHTDTEYDRFGNAVWRSNAWTSAPSPYGTRYTFDRLGRLLSTLRPDWALTKHEYTLFSTRTKDPAWNESYVETDVSGRVVQTGHLLGSEKRGEITFHYGPFDQIDSTQDAAKNIATQTHDALGRLRTRVDPDTGTTDFTYDGFGHLLSETRANGDVITHTYDVIGRQLTTTGPNGTDSFTYDVGPGAKRALSSATSFDGIETTFKYDGAGRLVQSGQTVDGVTRAVDRRYDAWSRVTHLFYPAVNSTTRFVAQYKYGVGGHLRNIADASTCGVTHNTSVPVPGPCDTAPKLWEVLARNENLSLTQAKYGNSQIELRDYYVDSGRLKKLTAAGTAVSFEYGFDGNLKKRYDQNSRLETFQYDELDRLTKWTLTGPKEGTQPPPVETTYDYSETGNLELVKKGGAVTFLGVYGGPLATPNQLAIANGLGGFTYDALGRQVFGVGRTIEWAHIDKPRRITEGGSTRNFLYDAFGNRAVRQSGTQKTIYFDKLHERRENGANVADVFLVYGEPGLVAQVEYAGPALPVTRYMVGDQQSTIGLTMVGTSPATRDYFDPFGKRIDKNGNAAVDSDAATTVGFTGQEEDDGHLVNMNGRIYDRKQYRFLSPDPVIAQPLFGQSYNPYSYVLNNPVRYTDPSGFAAFQQEPPQPPPPPAGPTTPTPPEDPRTKKQNPPPGPLVVAVDPPPEPQAQQSSDASAGKTTVLVSEGGAGPGEARGSDGGAPPNEPQSGYEGAIDGASGGPSSPEDVADWNGATAGASMAPFALLALPWVASSATFWGVVEFGGMAFGVSSHDDPDAPPIIPLGIAAWGAEAGMASVARGSGGLWNALRDLFANCFPAGTLVQSVDGPVPIELIQKGDWVIARDPTTGETALRQVVDTMSRTVDAVVELELHSDGRVTKVQATPEHPFWGDDGWTKAGDIQVGDQVFSLQSGWLRVGAATWIQGKRTVYNFEVEGFHTYFVGDVGAWVHNHCSARLGRALEAAGHIRYPGYEAHHIVAGGAPGALRAQKVLDKWGIGIDDAANGVFLPGLRGNPAIAGSAVHRGGGLHSKEYYSRINDLLEKATSKEEALATLEVIRQSLMRGGL